MAESSGRRGGNAARPTADATVREQALDPAGSFIVQAPAGSGKTELLIQRLLVLLAHVQAPEEILAITFTRKAAGEMRARLLKILAEAARAGNPAGQPELPAHEAEALQRAKAVLARERELGWHLLEAPGRLRIQTIDAFCNDLAGRAPLRAEIPPSGGIATDPWQYYREAAEAVLALVEAEGLSGDAAARIWLHLDNNRARTLELLCTLLSKRDQWLRHLTAGREPADLRAALEAELALTVTHALTDLRGGLSAAADEALWRELGELAGYAADWVDDPTTVAGLRALAALRGLPPAEAGSLEVWRVLAGWLTTALKTWRKSITVREGFPPGKEGGDRPLQKEMKVRMEAVLAQLREDSGLAEALGGVRELPPTAYSEGQWRVMEALLLLLPETVRHLRKAFAAGGETDFVELGQAALRVLSAGPGAGLPRHVLVDEFQDTSHTQFQLLRLLTAGWTPEDGRTLFLVGDPMQSIYRFREAEVGLFLRARQEGLGDVMLQSLTLRVNFRSDGALVDWVGRVFPEVMPGREDARSGAVPFSPATAHQRTSPRPVVHVHPLLEHPGQPREAVDALEAEKVAGLVQKAQAGNPGGTVAILARSRTHLHAILPRLREAGLVFRAVEIEGLAERQVVRDLLALTRALLHPADRVAWLALLRSPLCGLTLADLAHLAEGHPWDSLWERLLDEEALSGLGPDGRSRMARLRAAIGPALAARERRPLRRWVEGVWVALGGPACIQGADVDNAHAFFGLLEAVEDVRGQLASEVLAERVGSLFAAPDPEAGEALQVMSIHKAKGLEFDTVILPGLGKWLRSESSPLMGWMERPPSGNQPGGLLLAPIHGAGDESDPIFAYLGRLEGEKESHETARLLYVAVTRARRALHLLGHTVWNDQGVREPSRRTLLHWLWPWLAEEFERQGEGAAPVTAEAAGGTDGDAGQQPLLRLPAGWVRPAPPAAPVAVAGAMPTPEAESLEPLEFSWAGETARHVGTLAHRLLNLLSARGAEPGAAPAVSRQALRTALAGLGVAEQELERAASDVERALLRTLDDPRGRWLLQPHEQARSEFRVSGMVEGEARNFIIDRTFVDEHGVRWIVDYKTGGHEGGDLEAFLDREQERYRGQLENYARILARMEPGRSIRLALYFPLLGGWREWEPPAAALSNPRT